MTLRSRLGLIRLRRQIAAYVHGHPDADGTELLTWARRGEGYREAVRRETERHVSNHLSLRTFQAAEALLTPLDNRNTIARLADQLTAEQPRLLYPHLAHIRVGLRTRAAVVAAAACDDLTDADLNTLYDGAHSPLRPEYLPMIHDYITEHAAQSVVPVYPAPARVGRLLDLFASDVSSRDADIAAWAQSPEEHLFAFRTAVTMREPAMIERLLPTIDIEQLTDRQKARAASLLWRGGTEELAVPLARAVRTGVNNLRRARAIIDEFESFEYMDSGWTPPALSETPLYTPAPRSILHVLHNSLPYRTTGSANRTQGLLAGLADNGYAISAINPPGFPYGDVPPEKLDTIKADFEVGPVSYHNLLNDGEVIPRFRLGAFLDAYTTGIIAQAERDKAALIHSASNGYNGLAGTVAARRIGIPNIYEVRGLNEEGRRSRDERYAQTRQYAFAHHLETLAANEADRVIAITEGLRATLVERGVDPAKILVVPNGVDTRRFGPLERDVELARQYGLEGKLVIGYIGSLNWYEGHDLLFEAVRRLRPRHPDMRVLIVGGGQEYEHLLALRSELGLDDVIVMTGRIPFEQVEAHYSLIDIAPITRSSSPVTESTSPLKPFEAMAMGKTVISSDVAVMKEVFNGDNGLLYTKDDADSLESVLEQVLLDESLRARLGEGGRSWVIAERDWSTLAARVTRLYAELGVA
ncbi:glycosyltransferase family 4 protein [Aeromicrobium sp. NPDC092404]|uniref:glycosyltransferase family 4 protein n=1 Tax=Aeromicrobium sp. NPDC092404 TaxID=3154976 RepID=UPI0034343FC2